MLKKTEVTQWQNSPVSKALFKTIKEHLEGIREEIQQGIIQGPPLDNQALHIYSQLKGQYLAFEQVEDIKQFLELEFEEDNSEERSDAIEISAIESESDSQG